MPEFYVYVDRKPPSDECPDGEPFYVGKGNESRVTKKKRNKWHAAICAKHPDWFRERVLEGTEAECFAEERRLIALYGRRDLGLGSLVNLTDGGEGPAGLIHSEESRRKNAAAKTGVKQSAETVKKRADALRGRKRPPRSEETLMKMSAARKGKPAHNKGKPLTDAQKDRLRTAHAGKTLTEEHKAAISAAFVTRGGFTEEELQRMSAKGRKQSAEHVAARVAAVKATVAARKALEEAARV